MHSTLFTVRKFLEPLKAASEDAVLHLKAASEDAVLQLNNKVRSAVSKDKFRFKNEDFDLDLSYITNRLIAMGYPGSNVEKAWRNSRDDVARFLKSYHQDHYMIFNVSEKPYDGSFFEDKVVFLGWPDHHGPSLALLTQCIQMIDSWLNEDPLNVAVIHCMAGRGRTGCVISAYMLHNKQFTTAEDALHFFAVRRSSTEEGVTVPSQKRYVKYIEQLLSGQVALAVESKVLKLKCILFRPVPSYGFAEECTPSIEILRMGQFPELLYTNQTTELRTYTSNDSAIMIDMGGMSLQGDVLIRVYHEGVLTGITTKMMFRFGFHTSFVSASFLDLYKNDLDDSSNGALKDERFPLNFCVRLMFSEV